MGRPWPRRNDFRRAGNYYLAALSEIARGPLRRYGRRGAAPTPPSEWRRGILLGPNHIGDVLYNTPALPALRNGLPNCRWSYAVSGTSAQALRNNPYLDEVISIDDPGGSRGWHQRARDVLARHSFDVAIAYAVGSSWKDLWLAASLGIPNRVGYVHKGFSGLVTHPISIRIPQPFPAYFRDLVCQLTGQPPEAVPSLRPLVYPHPREEETVNEWGARAGLDWSARPILACSVTSRQPSGIWPREQFLRAILQTREQLPCTVIYLGAKSDAADLRRLAGRTGPDAFVVAGELDLPAVVALLRRCRAALAPDSGARHLANAAGTPVVFLRNLFNRKIETGVYCDTDHDLAPDRLELVDPAEQAAAFAAVDSATVAAELVRLLRRSA
jgi:ADP-heptose:LPS heptosyltransferase